MSKKLFVGNIPFKATETEIRELFSPHGEITDIFIPLDRATSRPRGFAFVTYTDEACAKTAQEALNGSDLGGRSIAVDLARPVDKK
ncbi:MAG: RNA-binding protein [Verrucomicrobiota bacterium]